MSEMLPVEYDGEELMTVSALADYCEIDRRTLPGILRYYKVPVSLKIGRRSYYCARCVVEAVKRHERVTPNFYPFAKYRAEQRAAGHKP
jgi:hypothetical protein